MAIFIPSGYPIPTFQLGVSHKKFYRPSGIDDGREFYQISSYHHPEDVLERQRPVMEHILEVIKTIELVPDFYPAEPAIIILFSRRLREILFSYSVAVSIFDPLRSRKRRLPRR